jgi:protein SDA1
MGDAEPEKQERALSLPSLQNLMKRDPEAYELEFDQQWSHFTSMMELWKLKPQKPSSAFGEQVMFLAHVAPSFPAKAAALPGVLIDALGEHSEVMHPQMRQTLVQALVLLRNRNLFECMRTLPTYFKLFRLQDKSLRHMIFAHIVKDLVSMGQRSRSQKSSGELREFFFGQLKESDVEVARRACAVFISMYRQNVWRDNHVVNLMSSGLLHPDVKCAAALAHLFLGNRTKGLEGILEESDKEDEDVAEEAIRGIVGAKKTANREKKVERAKKAAKKAIRKKRAKQMEGGAGGVCFVAIDLINDPQTLADRLLQRVSKGSEPFLFRLLMLHLVARLIGRHELLLLNLYPFLLKYLIPTQREVTKVLAILVEACHAQVPPEELRPVVMHVMNTFVTEAQAPEVIEVGMNGIREVCSRAINILTEEELADLAGFRKHKNKGVAMAARSLINTYRELHPQLLHRSLRGREATMALSRGEVAEPVYGTGQASDKIDGLELLSAKEEAKRERGGEKAGEDPQKVGEAAKQMMSERVIGSDEFKQLRKLRLQKSVQMQLGRKRKAEEISSSSDSEGTEVTDSDEEASDGEAGMPGRLPDAVSGDLLKASKKRAKGKNDKQSRIKEGRTDFKEKLMEKRKDRKGGSTNKEKIRHKPQLMQMQSKSVQKKKAQTSKQKLSNLRKHISSLKKTANHQKRRRA